MKTRICSKCRKEKFVSEFYYWKPPNAKKYYHTGFCKDCMRAYSKQYRLDHLEQERKNDRDDWRKNIKESRRKARINSKNHYRDNRIRIRTIVHLRYLFEKFNIKMFKVKNISNLELECYLRMAKTVNALLTNLRTLSEKK